jgi:hypothetical protein
MKHVSILPLQETAEYQRLSTELEGMRAMRRRVTLDEPECRYIGDPPGKSLALAYANQFSRTETAAGICLPVFCAAIPPNTGHRVQNYLVSALLEQLGDRDASKREDIALKSWRFIKLLRQYAVELVILTDVHHLTTPGGTKLLHDQFDWIKWIFKSELQNVALLLVGEIEVLEELIEANAQFSQLLLPIDLGE